MVGKLKVALIHPEIRNYRIGILNRLSEEYDLSFFITQKSTAVESYPERDKWNYQTFHLHLRFPSTNRSFPPGIFLKILLGGYDVVISSDSTAFETMLAFAASKISKKKFIIWTELWDYPKLLRFKLVKPFIKFMTRNSDALITAGSKAKRLFIEFGAKEDDVFVAPDCAVDYTNAKTEDLRKKFGLGDKKVVLYLGRIVRYKGLDFLLRAFAKLEEKHKNVFLVVGGDGPFEDECKSLARELRIKNIKFVGHVIDVASYYKMSDLFVLPARFVHDSVPSEAWGLVLNEVMSVGKPVIATDAVAGAFDLIEDGVNGFMVENKKVDALRDALEKILLDDKLRESMGAQSRRIIEERFTYDKMFNGFKYAIEYAINRG